MSANNALTPVTVTHKNGISCLKLNRPDHLNALNAEMVESLISGLDEAVQKNSHLIIFSGEGRAFSAGFDLSSLDQQSDADLLYRFVRVEQLLQHIFLMPITTLALVHGRCFGAAADMVAACSHRIAAPGSSFRMPGLQFGIVLGTRRLANLIGRDAALDLLETSRVFSAETALDCGFITAIHETDYWPELTARIAANAGSLNAHAKAKLMGATRDEHALDSDLAELVRSAALPGLADRVRHFVASQVKK
jgi:enoyl-CoA hydratase